MAGVSVDVQPVPRAEVPKQAYGSRLYTAADIEAMIEMLAVEPVLLGNTSCAREREARYRAATLRRYLADYDVMVTSRTWPEFNGEDVCWRWCVILKDAADG